MATRFLIEGRVQGVGYRNWLQEEAQRRGLRGTVRNLRDGRVEAVVVGTFEETDALLAACRQGPPMAKVTGIGLDPVGDPSVTGFVVLPTA
ncbi:acylphosphatase [Acuticoccus sp. I52.16.1]|uniref:acylphosphatase n=1 Tax=Acuticoccus sp. I52.16.1 TaxID=2928472 RepID=UPI001FD2D25F|nr:acylphosphatase [Acuticoccus sp. I52.16.1]UOM33663.1 acylphosphatase [Acuticoccus sp. I52.16.1]